MADENLQRAVAIQALVGEVTARLQEGESAASIRADLLAEGIPPEVIDHAFAMSEGAHPQRRWRTILAFSLSVVLLLGLPLAGAVGVAWVAVELTAPPAPPPQPEPNPEVLEREVQRGNPAARDLVVSILAIIGGFFVGGALGVALALPMVRTLSEWSMQDASSDEAYE
jgi:hypothetical protein